MKLDISSVSDVSGSSMSFEIEGNMDDIDDPQGPVRFETPVHLAGRAWNISGDYLVQAEAKGEAILRCDRCLKDFEWPFELELESYHVRGVVDSGPWITEVDEEQEARLFQGEQIELDGLFYEAVLLDLPIKRLCSPDCRGICPVCGQDLNEGECGCSVDDTDPRLATLGELIEDDETGSDGGE